MATLVGRNAWYVGFPLLRFGKIAKHKIGSGIMVLETIDGSLTIHPTSALLTRESALAAIEEAIDYWEGERKKMQAQINGS